MKFIPYPKIKQFKDAIRHVACTSDFKGIDEKCEPIYENSVKPVVEFTGTIKIHGTNAGISYSPKEGLFPQKRSSLLSYDYLSAHFGFVGFVHNNKAQLTSIMKGIHTFRNLKPEDQVIMYGEWAGEGIQKGVAISEHKKSFFVFDVALFDSVKETIEWFNIETLTFSIENMYNIHLFQTHKISIDFNKPGYYQNSLILLTNLVEEQCPVSRKLGYKGVGEGIVWTGYYRERIIFKVKGVKHSASKVKTLAPVDEEVLNSIHDFVGYACTKNRIEQGIQETNVKLKSDMPILLKWVANDIISEEDEALKANNLEWKQVAKEVSNKTRQYFFSKIDKI